MKPFAIWLAIVVVVFGVYALIASSLRETTQVFVFVDSSQPMESVWSEVPRELGRIDDRSNSEFALAHGQSRSVELVHTWQSELDFSGVTPFAPCSFAEIGSFAESSEADDRILITTTGSCPTDALDGWEVVLLGP